MTADKSKSVQIRLIDEKDAELILSCGLDDNPLHSYLQFKFL